MPETAYPEEAGEREPIRVPDSHLEGIEASVRKLMEQSAQQARQLDDLASEPMPSPFAAFGMPGPSGSRRLSCRSLGRSWSWRASRTRMSRCALGLGRRLLPSRLRSRGHHVGAWCLQWQEHHDVVAWLHALWLAYQQHKDPETGLSGMLVWHRDCLTHAVAAIRGPGGPLSACMTSPDRPSHRLLPGPKPSARTADKSDEPGGDLDVAA